MKKIQKGFFAHKKLIKPSQKVAYLWQLGVAQNSPELHFCFIIFFIQSSLLRSLPNDFYIMTLVACRMYNQTESLVPGRRVFFVPSRFVCENVESIEINRKQSETVSRQAQPDNFHYPLQGRWNQGGWNGSDLAIFENSEKLPKWHFFNHA